MSSQPQSPIPEENEIETETLSTSSTINELEPRTVVLGSQTGDAQQSEPDQMPTEERKGRSTTELIHSEEESLRKATVDSSSSVKDSSQTAKGNADTHSVKHGFDGSEPGTSHSGQPPTVKEVLPDKLQSFPPVPRPASAKADEENLNPATTSMLEGTTTGETNSSSHPRRTDDQSDQPQGPLAADLILLATILSATFCKALIRILVWLNPTIEGLNRQPGIPEVDEAIVCQPSDDVELDPEQCSDDVDDDGQDCAQQPPTRSIYDFLDDVREYIRDSIRHQVFDPDPYREAQLQRTIAPVRERGALVPQAPVTIPIAHHSQQNQSRAAAANMCVNCLETIHATPPSRLDTCLRCDGTVCSNCLERPHFCLFFRCVDCLRNQHSSLYVRRCPNCRGRICLDCVRYWSHRCTPG